ncbi:LptE family protein [Paludisphaera mucosa]|uniref:LptE family protein n=1 Tax=Paludisphaera mucosa TaxID=3030827 RepID=A0ABT6FG68_9BACT|nr:LptE family protein [Paludisphaera mucosa]MDG3006564.1 LptE family protein [Paludisphaera mucosa]
MFGLHQRRDPAAPTPRRPTAAAWALLALVGLAACGCGYSFRAPYDKSVRTVYVPMFKSQTFTRDVEKMLTEMVQKEIGRRTPYRLVDDVDAADTVLTGTINFVDKNIVVESPFNLPRQLTRTVNVSVNWVHNPPTTTEKTRAPTIISDTVNFVPEIGETSLTATYQVCQRLAAQIIDMMEQPWYTEEDLK